MINMVIKFLKKGIKVDGKYIPVHYSMGNYSPHSGLPEGTITLYAQTYRDKFPEDLNPQNDTDSQSDYHEKDRARIRPGSKYYNEAKKAMGK